MLTVEVVSASGQPEQLIDIHYSRGMAEYTARIAAEAAGRHGFTGRAVVQAENGLILYKVSNRGGFYREYRYDPMLDPIVA